VVDIFCLTSTICVNQYIEPCIADYRGFPSCRRWRWHEAEIPIMLGDSARVSGRQWVFEADEGSRFRPMCERGRSRPLLVRRRPVGRNALADRALNDDNNGRLFNARLLPFSSRLNSASAFITSACALLFGQQTTLHYYGDRLALRRCLIVRLVRFQPQLENNKLGYRHQRSHNAAWHIKFPYF